MLGLTILPEYIQCEGTEKLLDHLQEKLPLTAVSISPYVMEECPPDKGGEREPPADSGKGLARMLDRPLWGKREVWVRTAPSFVPNHKLYEGLRYQPQKTTGLTRKEGRVIDEFVESAQRRGIQVYFQIQAAIPPGYRVQFGGPMEDDKPRLPDGSIPARTLDNNGSLASPHILEYGEALIRDLLTRYPRIDGIRVDWPEYPPYFLESIFLDFSHHARTFAEANGFDFEALRREAGSLLHYLKTQMDDRALNTYLDRPEAFLENWTSCREWLRFKSAMVTQLLTRFNRTVREAGEGEKAFFPSAFPPPWNMLSGFDYTTASEQCQAVSCKFYTMHWPMMLRNYGDAIRETNSRVSEATLAAFLARVFDAVRPVPDTIDKFHYPEPNEPHPVDPGSLAGKFALVKSMTRGPTLWPIAHSYGPAEDFIRRSKAVLEVSDNRLWVNRYAYLSEEKLEALSDLFEEHKG